MGIDPRDTREMWSESLDMIPKIWDSKMFEYEGKFWKVPAREVLPKPYQDPHPPLWVAALQPATYELAAEKGIGVLALSFTAPELLEPHIKAYRENVKKANPVGKFINNQWLSLSQACCDEDDAMAKEKAGLSLKTFIGPDKPYLQGQANVYENLLEQWGGIPDHLKEDFARSAARNAVAEAGQLEIPTEVDQSGGGALAEWAWKEIGGATLAERGVVIGGNPESCIKGARLYEATGIDQLGVQVATEILDHNAAMKTIEMFGKYVIPEFKKAEAKV
jgi:alkanesulfonate monooxygenase SsuD/methylene tetrahydromethanopterin reductase-like flavin-dependent oxidoreductase (luciferase family)